MGAGCAGDGHILHLTVLFVGGWDFCVKTDGKLYFSIEHDLLGVHVCLTCVLVHRRDVTD